jgi:carbon starvation protein CstA
MRRDGKSLGQMAREEIGPFGGAAALVAVLLIMIILLAVLALVVVNALGDSPWGTFSIAMTIPIALFMGVYMRVLRPGRVIEVSAIGVVLLLLAIGLGSVVAESRWAEAFTLSPEALVYCLVIYGFAASVLPVWLLLAPRDYLSTFMKVGTIALLALGILLTLPVLKIPAVTDFAFNGQGPVFAGSLFPFVFITIACGALSGFHSLIASGTTPKLIEKEAQVRFVGYGGMLTEAFVAIMALIAASIIEPGLYFAMNSPAGVVGATAESASAAVANLGFTITPETLNAAAAEVEERTLVARTGGAPTLAIGMSEIFSRILGGGALKAFWYHFAIMFEALFILTTVDAGTRVGRFMLQDTLGNLWKPLGRPSWRDQPARRHQPAVPAVRDRQPAAGGDRADGGDDHPDQVGQAQVGLGDGGAAGLGRSSDADGELAEGVLGRHQARLLRPAGQVPGRPGPGEGAGPGQDPGPDAAGRHQLGHRRRARRGLRAAGGRGHRRCDARVGQGAAQPRAPAAHRGPVRGVHTDRPLRADPDR